MAKLILIRGVSGSGKSTYAKEHYPDLPLVEADDYFMVDGEYRFNPEGLPEAHQMAKRRMVNYMLDDGVVVVANPFTRKWEVDNYLEALEEQFEGDYELEVIRLETRFENIHGLTPELIQMQVDRFEDYPMEFIVG